MPLPLQLENLAPGALRILLHPIWVLLALPRDIEAALKVSAECCPQVRKVFLDENLRLSRKGHFKDEAPGVFPGLRISYRAVARQGPGSCPYGAIAAFLLYIFLCRSGRMGYEGYRTQADCPPKALFRADPMRRLTVLMDNWYPGAMSIIEADLDPLVDRLPVELREEVRTLVQNVIDSQPYEGMYTSSMTNIAPNAWAHDEESWIKQDAIRLFRALKSRPDDSKRLEPDIRQALLKLHDYRVRRSFLIGA
ncbi:MAG: hypothetical protein SF172_15090 [Burkholderiales bacterium]|nr:hypothetical protein [Burkholderiales bacterium]